MAPMIDRNKKEGSRRFYEEIAADYDDMTGFEQRFPHERPFFHLLVERYRIRYALDAGCGTGFHSILLAQLGVHVTATDIAEGMLLQVQLHAKEYGVHLRTCTSTFQDLAKTVTSKFDAVFCMGNTLAHLLTVQDLHRALKNFHQVLKPGGILFFQNVNYNRILLHRERVQSIKEGSGKIFVRFYDYEKSLIRFNILSMKKTNEGIAHALKSVMLHPWKSSEILRLTRKAGFTDVQSFGSIALQKFDAETSKDIVILTQRTA